MNTRTKPSHYPLLPYYAVRTISFISAVIVTGIVGFFCKQLWADKYKIPWTFIIVFLAGILNIAGIIFTSIISCCTTLSPVINILFNIPVLFLWIFGISLLTWNIYGTLSHTCSVANWGNNRGILVCQIYKALYSFVVFANLSHIAQLVLDIRARHKQLQRGKYDKMRESQDIKIDDLKPLSPHTIHDQPMASETSLHQFRDVSPQREFRDESPGWRPGQPTHSNSYTSSNYGNNRRDDRFYEQDIGSGVHMQDFTHGRPQPTHYDSGSYHSGSGYDYQQESYYQRRY